MTPEIDFSWLPGLHEVFVKIDDKRKRVGYFDDLHKALDTLAGDGEYRAVWFSLNICPRVPDGFDMNRLYQASGRFKKEDYARRQLLFIDCDPEREPKDSSATEAQKAFAHTQVLAIREYLRAFDWPEPIFADSGNGYHLLYAINEPNDEATEWLIRDFLAGLSAKFSNEESHVDEGNFDACRICKLYGTVARKGDDPGLWRRSTILEIPTRSVELPKGEKANDLDFEAVPRGSLEAVVKELPVPRREVTVLGDMTDNDHVKVGWLRRLLAVDPKHSVVILGERRQGKKFVLDIECPMVDSHRSTTGDTSTSVMYERGRGYGFSCLHGSCQSHKPKGGIPNFKAFRGHIDPTNLMSDKLPGLPWEVTHAKIADYVAGLDAFQNHRRVYDAKKLRTTFVGTRWDLVCQDDTLLEKAVQPVLDRLRYDMPEGLDRRNLDNHSFRVAVLGELKPRRSVVRFDQLDADAYLIGMAGGMVGNLRNGVVRKMERDDFITKRLRVAATNTPTPVYDYFLRSISSANDQPADMEWMSYFELLHGYFLIGHCNHHIWPLWTGEGGNGKSVNAQLIKRTLSDFCALVRWSELSHDERGGDNTPKRLYYKLLQSRVALVEEMGQVAGANRVLETSTIKQLTGGGEITGADLYSSEVTGEIKFKLVAMMNKPPNIEPDAAFKRRVRVIPFRALFDELKYPGCLELAMERKSAPAILRASPYRLSELLAEERPGILYKWILAARRFIEQGEELGNIPASVREATAAMFHEADIQLRFLTSLEYGPDFDVSQTELREAAESFFKDNGRDPRTYNVNAADRYLQVDARPACTATKRLVRGERVTRGWKGVRLPIVTLKIGKN